MPSWCVFTCFLELAVCSCTQEKDVRQDAYAPLLTRVRESEVPVTNKHFPDVGPSSSYIVFSNEMQLLLFQSLLICYEVSLTDTLQKLLLNFQKYVEKLYQHHQDDNKPCFLVFLDLHEDLDYLVDPTNNSKIVE